MNPATNPATNPALDTLHALRDNWAAGGDMGRPDGFVAVREGVDGGGEAFGGEAYAVKIELWTDDCLMDLKKQDEAAARRRGEALAKKWAKEHWPHTGYVDLGGAEGVYGATWAWDKATENELERTDPDEVVRLPAARSNPEDDTVEKLKEWGAPEAVAEKIAEVVEKVGTCTDAKAMTGQCMDVSARLARELNGMTYVDDYGYAQTVRAFSTQLWDVPKRLQSNTLAHGHYVVKVETDSGVLWIDLTAAQFGERGPGVVAGPRVPAVGDFEPFWEGRSNPPSRKPLDKDLYADVVAEAKSRFDVWPSAYASGWVVKTYKARGGRYAGGGARGLTKWFGEEWVDLSRPIHDEDGELVGYEPCGRKASDDPAAYPKCRPLAEALRMSPSEVKDAVKRKRAAEAKAGRGAKGRGGRGARAPVRVSTYRANPDAAARLGPVVDTEEWDDGTVVEFVAVPFPVERKPLSYKDDPEVSGSVRVEDLIATQRRVTKAGVEKYLDDIAGRVGRAGNAGRAEKIRVYETHDGRRYIADGHHRAVAAWAAGVEVLPAVIQLVRENPTADLRSNPDVRRPRPRAREEDMLDAIQHADVYGDQGWTLDDFTILPMGEVPLSRVLGYEDCAWLDVDPEDFAGMSAEERLAELSSFRGPKWAARAAEWLSEGVPPIVVIDAPVVDEAHLYRQIGDGRGRVNFALAMGLKTLPVVIMKWKHPL